MKDLLQILRGNTYPGRGIAIGRTADGTQAVLIYFIMGRSENSRNRVFVRKGDGIRTEAFDPSKMQDPRLIIYAPVRKADAARTIVTNGDQTDTIYDFLIAGRSFAEALETRTFEPDAPNYTPRISGLLTVENGMVQYQLSILKSASGDPAACDRFYFHYAPALPGRGHFLSTYRKNGDPLPSFSGTPVEIAMPEKVAHFVDDLWEALDAENKVALFVRTIDLQSREEVTYLKNVHGEGKI